MTVQVDLGASTLGFRLNHFLTIATTPEVAQFRLFGHVVLRIFHDLKYDMFLFQYAVLK